MPTYSSCKPIHDNFSHVVRLTIDHACTVEAQLTTSKPNRAKLRFPPSQRRSRSDYHCEPIEESGRNLVCKKMGDVHQTGSKKGVTKKALDFGRRSSRKRRQNQLKSQISIQLDLPCHFFHGAISRETIKNPPQRDSFSISRLFQKQQKDDAL